MWSSKKLTKSAILSKYLIQLTSSYCAVAILFASLTLSAFYLRDLLKLGIEKAIPATLLLRVFGLTQLAQFGLVLPIALFLAVVVSLSGISAGREVIAMRAAGMSYWGISRPYARMALLLLPMMFAWHQVVIPWARGNFRELRSFIENYAPLDLGAADNHNFSLPADNGILRTMHFSEKKFDAKMQTHIFRGLSILEFSGKPGGEKISKSTYAENAFIIQKAGGETGVRNYLRLTNGYLLDFNAQTGEEWRATYFPQGILDLRLPESEGQNAPEERAKDSMYPPELLKKRDALRQSADAGLQRDAVDLDHEIHQRTALPFAIPVLLALGFLLAATSNAESRWQRIALSLLFISAYYAVFIFAKMIAVESRLMPTWLAAWLPNVMLLLPVCVIAVRLRRV